MRTVQIIAALRKRDYEAICQVAPPPNGGTFDRDIQEGLTLIAEGKRKGLGRILAKLDGHMNSLSHEQADYLRGLALTLKDWSYDDETQS